MSVSPEKHHQSEVPSRRSALIFRLKTIVLQANRSVKNAIDKSYVAHDSVPLNADVGVVSESSTPLWSEADPSERALQLGKVQNLRTAIRKLNGVQVPAHACFSFWSQLGPPTPLRGYVAGRELREGCLVPNIAGGLCQLSNALYDAALKAGFEIIERHAHSQIVPGSLAEQGRDATIFWNYVDLRFRSSEAFQIETSMTDEKLIVRIRSTPSLLPGSAGNLAGTENKSANVQQLLSILPAGNLVPNSCMSCGVADCFRSAKVAQSVPASARTAYLVDEFWPEFDAYICNTKHEQDSLCLPIDGNKFRRANYAWTTSGFAQIREQHLLTALRSYESRSLGQQGASRQRSLLKHQKQLAHAYASGLDYDITHLVVTQGLLPFLWADGVLGGRTFDVLMTNLPLAKLHERLDGAHELHSESSTLADFRADNWLVRAENEALRRARQIITPHSEIADLFGEKALLLDWRLQSPRVVKRGSKIIFPASTLGRKGAYEMREAAEKLNLSLVVMGQEIEGTDFWRNVPIEKANAENWLDDAALVVLPAWLEQKPRRLLEAVSCGVPVIASRACGLEKLAQVMTIKTGDVSELCAAIKASHCIDQVNALDAASDIGKVLDTAFGA